MKDKESINVSIKMNNFYALLNFKKEESIDTILQFLLFTILLHVMYIYIKSLKNFFMLKN